MILLHDLRSQKGKHAFQIDHLVVTRYGIALIESNSIHRKVSITRHDERREHWSRKFRSRDEGIPSLVRQVQEHARLVQAYLCAICTKGRDVEQILKGLVLQPFRVETPSLRRQARSSCPSPCLFSFSPARRWIPHHRPPRGSCR